MTGYDFHPEARVDLDEIWEFIHTDNLEAADRVIAEILSPSLLKRVNRLGEPDLRAEEISPCSC